MPVGRDSSTQGSVYTLFLLCVSSVWGCATGVIEDRACGAGCPDGPAASTLPADAARKPTPTRDPQGRTSVGLDVDLDHTRPFVPGPDFKTPDEPPPPPPPPPQPDVGQYEVFEITVPHSDGGYANPWEQVSLQASFLAPSGATFTVDGFYYDRDTWKLRFAAKEVGTYQWSYHLDDAQGQQALRSGAFLVGVSQERGFIRAHPRNLNRYVYERDGGIFSAQGLASCIPDPVATSFPTARNNKGWCIDKYGSDLSACRKTADEFLDVYAVETEIEIFRWSVHNCSFPLWSDLGFDTTVTPARPDNHYSIEFGKWGDAFANKLRARGVRIFMEPIGFGWRPSTSSTPSCGPNYDQPCNTSICGVDGDQACTDRNVANIATNDLASLKRYYRYIVARYGAYVDFWELINEFPLPNSSITELKLFVRGVDPYDHPITTSWARPDHPEVELSSPHLYIRGNVSNIDEMALSALIDGTGQDWSARAAHGKPIIVGEMGEAFGDRSDEPDYELITRHATRIKYWAGFFNEIGSIYWESSLTGSARLGGIVFFSPELRAHTRAHMRFIKAVDTDVRPSPVQRLTYGGQNIRRYELRSAQHMYLYLVHGVDEVRNPALIQGLSLSVTLPTAACAQWYRTTDGQVIASMDLAAGNHSVDVPDFDFDIALRTVPQTCP